MEGTAFLIVGGIALAAVALYVMDRYSKGKEIVWTDLGKIGVVSSLLTGGVLFAVQSDAGAAVVESVKATTQEMFVGTPAF